MTDDAALQVRTEFVDAGNIVADILAKVRAQAGQDVLDLHAELVAVMDDIKANYVPIESSDLADSGYVSDPFLVGDDWTIAIGFSSEHRGYDYALIQHERLDYYHPHGQAKYLEEPVTRWAASKGAET